MRYSDGSGERFGPRRILVIGPDRAPSLAMARALDRREWEVTTATTACETREALRSWRPHLVVLDDALAADPAGELADAIVDAGPTNVPILVVSATRYCAEAASSPRTSAADPEEAPCDRDALLAQVDALAADRPRSSMMRLWRRAILG